MKKFSVGELKPGMIFSHPVYVDGENLLIQKGIPLKAQDIERLIRWQISEVATEGDPVLATEPVVDSHAEEKPQWPNQRQTKYLKLYVSLVEQVDRIFQDISSGKSPAHDGIDSVVNEVLEKVRIGRTEMVQLILMGAGLPGAEFPRRFSTSAIHCAILSTMCGISLKLAGHRLLQLTTGALLHDVGMLRLPAGLLRKKEKLTPEEQQQIHTHPILGYRIISRQLKYPEDVAVIALQHQERWDGRGYPRRVQGENIQLTARIVAVADSYEAMITVRPHRDPVISYGAMKSILSDNGRHFDPGVLRAFLEGMGIYPIGSIVQLNNSSIGRVVENHSDAPLRPRIELLIDEYSARIQQPETVDLVERKNLFIVKAVDSRSLNA